MFLFDESLSNLDPKLRVQTRVEIKKIHARLGITAVYVTHDQIGAMTLGDRAVVMRDGVSFSRSASRSSSTMRTNRFLPAPLARPR
ncbi:hypothetical protein [Bradyrhizobium sp. STM 3557]|uniref:hypothetical protein n=1 Tax=Bradyrhizobium sp. STM 3557 TaxID=578920 RepID=UPI00388FC85D